MPARTEVIVFGGGCFWCTEAVFKLFKGVVGTEPGYAGGTTPNPDYKLVCTGRTGHAEVLKIEYDPETVSLDRLLDVFFKMHDPTTKERQGADVGTQYRSIILYSHEAQKDAIQRAIERHRKDFGNPIVTEVKKLTAFYPAEDYHKDYYDHNRFQPYCAIVIGPKIKKIKKEFGLE